VLNQETAALQRENWSSSASGGIMSTVYRLDRRRNLAAFGLIALSAVSLWGCGGGGGSGDQAIPLTVPKASCGPNDKPETGLQGQVPAALRASGFKGFNCNLQLAGQSKGDGANWQHIAFQDRAGHSCAYHGTSFATADRTQLGVVALNVTTLTNPTPTAYLTSTAMLDPWESLKVNERRQLIAADNGHRGSGGPEIDIYDVSGDCTQPQLLSSTQIGIPGAAGPVASPAILGHEGAWAPDGLTYYVSSTTNHTYYAVDTVNTTKPALIASFNMATIGTSSHGLSISNDGNRAYFVQDNNLGANLTQDPTRAQDGVLIADVSDIQKRLPNAQIRMVSRIRWYDGTFAQHTIPVTIGGKPYLVAVDEGGAGGLAATAAVQAACAAGMSPFPMARIIDLSDEMNAKVVSKLMLETHDPANCDKVLPDIVGLTTFTYGSHYCSVDNRTNATTLACGYFNSGIRVFDIRDPIRPKEIAYFNPPGAMTPSPGSDHLRAGGWVAGGPDWCSAQVHLDAPTASLWTSCQDNGELILKFENAVWPFPETSTTGAMQN
jgi:hypothetical protein